MCSDSISELWSKDMIEPNYRSFDIHRIPQAKLH